MTLKNNKILNTKIMKRFLLSVALATTLALTSCQFDDSAIWSKLDEYGESIRDHEQRISALEELCKQMNTNIEALQTLVNALEKRDYITNISHIREDGEVIGYTISFAYSDTITIYHSKDGKDGYTPQIGVMKDSDGIYYWTLDGVWLLDANGNKIKAVGTDGADGKDGQDGTNGSDGKDGQDGQDGTNGSDGKDGQDGTNGTDGKDGADGKDGITPQLKIENDYWYVSYDNGATWVQLGKATGEDGKDGNDGEDGDSIFKSVTQDDEYVYFNLADGTTITLPKGEKEEVVSENNKIYYTTSDNTKLFPKTDASLYGAILISNTYKDGQGVLVFDDVVTSIGNSTFSSCSRLTSVTIPDSVTSIGSAAFYRCTSLTSVTIPDSVTSIGRQAFYACTSLKSITIPDSVTSIGDLAFQDCTSLTSVTIPDSVTSIGSTAFCDCTSLISVTIGNSVTSIGDLAFQDCTSLTSVTIGNGVTKIGGYAFYGCTSLTSVTIPESVTSIGERAFSGCTSLISVTIGNSVTSIGMAAFYYCTSLTSVTIPDSVTSIGSSAFCDCTSLTSVYCKPTTPPAGDGDRFNNNASGRKIYVPRNSVKAYKANYYWSDYASDIEGYDF